MAGGYALNKVGNLKEDTGCFGTLVDGEYGVAFFAAEQGVERVAKEWMIGGEKLNIVPVEGIGTVEGGHHAFGVEPGQAVHLPILGLEQIAAIAKVFDAQANIFHEVGGEGLKGGVGIGCLDLFTEHFALTGFIGVAGKQAKVAIFQFFTEVFSCIRKSVQGTEEHPASNSLLNFSRASPKVSAIIKAVGTGHSNMPTP